ncbi:hypothetical protein KSP40_PGU022180 [Platanthera guangdongensis]|uniref:Uncharacterized protein n=1 Tax=Platanthera guangdongensis TaxID=2320717 RepID=A0ABR2MTJ3_9ASPA
MKHLLGCFNDDRTEGILCQFPLDKACFNAYESTETVEASHYFESVKNKLHLSSSTKATAKALSVPELVVIVNTQNLEKNTIMSRRSSYQKILALEKRGVQVVERDINLTLDLIFSAAVCLVWYETRNIVDKTEEAVAISAVPAFIEDIATKNLMSLSLSFSGCILIFEGENNFLEYIMESSDMLYAAAASLDFNLQLFCSHMPETTDEIILNCIRTTGIIDRGLYSAMSESESIAESFLTRFPSLNPLSAHALLSCGGVLVEFLEWSHECRIQKIGNYKVPAESISLFNALCRYGELGESKSVMTDCSSIDSDTSGGILQPKSKRQRYGVSSHGPGMLMDESFYSEPSQLNRKSSGMLHPPSHSNKSTFHEAPEKPQLFSNAETIYRKHDVNYLNRNDCVGDTRARDSQPHDRFSDDLIDYNCSFLDEACAASRRGFNLRRSELGCEPATEGFLSSSRLSDGHASTFPSASEMNWVENALTNSSRSEESHGLKNAIFDEHLFAKRNYFFEQNHTDPHGQLKHANTVPSLGQFLRSKAREPSQQEGLPQQIIKSLGEANERRRAHQQSSCNTNPSFRCSLKRKATYQKKSPSIIDSFRYQGGTKQATDTAKKQNNLIRGRPSRQNLDKKDSPLIKPTWTPVDKRARQVTGALFNLLTLVRAVSIRFLGLKVVVDTPLHKGDDSPTRASYEVS